MFVNLSIQSTFTKFNSTNFVGLSGFGMLHSSCISSYYVTDYSANKIYILNEDWSYVSFKTFTWPTYMISVGTNLYMTGPENVWKLDKNLNILIEYNSTGLVWHRGIYYNSTNILLYVAPCVLTVIHVLNLNLTFSHSFSISTYSPWSINGYNNKMYVGTGTGIVLVVQNEIIVNQFNGCGGNIVLLYSILFDEYGYLATSCDNPVNKLFLFFQNGTYTGKTINTLIRPWYIGFDSKGHFILILLNQIKIYN